MQLKHSLTAVLVFFIQMLKFHEGTLWTLKCKPFSIWWYWPFQVSSDFEMTETEASNSFLIPSWSPEAEELCDTLQKDLIQNGNGDWLAHQLLLSSIDGETRLFTKAAVSELPGKFFEYQLFYNTKEQRVKGVIQFGPFTEGPVG